MKQNFYQYVQNFPVNAPPSYMWVCMFFRPYRLLDMIHLHGLCVGVCVKNSCEPWRNSWGDWDAFIRALYQSRSQTNFIYLDVSISVRDHQKKLFYSSSGSCHGSDVTWQEIGCMHWATRTTNFLPRHITTVARTGRGIEQLPLTKVSNRDQNVKLKVWLWLI